MKRSATLLFAVATSSTAFADPAPAPIKPRVLMTGAPACGNVSYKQVELPACRTAKAILAAVVEDLAQFRQVFAVFAWQETVADALPLTLTTEGRPRS